MFKREPKSFGATMARAVVAPVAMLALASTSYAAVGTLRAAGALPAIAVTPSAPVIPSAVTPQFSADRLAKLIKFNSCWTGPAPERYEGKIPGGAIVGYPRAVSISDRMRFDVEPRPVGGGDREVGYALDFLFNGDREHLATVYAFCPWEPVGMWYMEKDQPCVEADGYCPWENES